MGRTGIIDQRYKKRKGEEHPECLLNTGEIKFL
jgi:hypothetical protein